MVYETDFYTTRRPYRASPSLSTYTVTSEPSRQVRLLPGLGKVHVVHSYDRIVPYVGHKRLTVVTAPPVVVRLRPSTLYREFDRIENKMRPYSYNSYTNDYLNSESHVRIVYVRNPISSSYPVYRPSTLYTRYFDPIFTSSRSYLADYLDALPAASTYRSYYLPPRRYYTPLHLYPSDRWLDLSLYPTPEHTHFARMFDDETRAIKAQTNTLLNQIHSHVPRKMRPLPLPYTSRYDNSPYRSYDSNYNINKMIVSSPTKSDYTTYWSEPVKRQFCQGRMACVTIVGGKAHPRRKNIFVYYDDPVRSDIQLLSYYINRFKAENRFQKPVRALVLPLPPLRPSRVFSVPRPIEDALADTDEVRQLKEERAARMAKIMELPPDAVPKIDVKAKLAEEKAKREAAEAAKPKKSRRGGGDDDAAAQKAAEEAKKKAAEEAEAQRKAAEEAEAKRQADEAEAKRKADEAARKEQEAKEAADKAAELERLAEQARQEELVKQAEIERVKKEEEERARAEEEKRAAEAARAEEERQQLLRLEEIARQAEEEKEAELVRQAEELAELARQEAELAEAAKAAEEAAEAERKEAEAAELAQKEAELAELEAKEKELSEQAEQARAIADEAAERVASPVQDEEPQQEEADVVAEEAPIVEEPDSPAPQEDAIADEAPVEQEAATDEEAEEE